MYIIDKVRLCLLYHCFVYNKKLLSTLIISHFNTMIYIYIYMHICNHENNVPSRLSPRWLYGNSWTWAHDVRLHIAGTNEPKSAQQAK